MPNEADNAKELEAKAAGEAAAAEEKTEVKSKNIIGIHDVNDRYISTRDRRSAEEDRALQAKALENYKRMRTVQHGIVAGVMPFQNEETGDEVMCLSMIYEQASGIMVLIPFQNVFLNEIINPKSIDLKTAEGKAAYLKRQTQILRKMLGAEIPYTVEYVYSRPDEVIVIGSRAQALLIERDVYFEREETPGKKGTFVDKTIYRGKVLTVDPEKIIVTYGGVDKILRKQYVTNQFSADLRRLYQTNDLISIKVFNAKYDEKGKLVNVDFDALSGELYEAQEKAKKLKPGTTCLATISKITPYTSKDGLRGNTVYGWIEIYNVPCRFRSVPTNRYGMELHIGDQVMVTVTDMDDKGYITCKGTQVTRSTGF